MPKRSAESRIGERFGRLIVIDVSYKQRRGSMEAYAHCKCDCGKDAIKKMSYLVVGETKSCGCLAVENQKMPKKTTHGLTLTPEWQAWVSMKSRCSNPKNNSYHRYGGRGIEVCNEWINDFLSFLREVGTKPSPSHSIGRIDNDKNYEPGNCRWETSEQQQDNRCINVHLTINGKTQTISKWAREVGMHIATVGSRLHRGWSPHDAVFMPPSQKGPRYANRKKN